jgi:lipopolysaccharide export system protein LptA
VTSPSSGPGTPSGPGACASSSARTGWNWIRKSGACSCRDTRAPAGQAALALILALAAGLLPAGAAGQAATRGLVPPAGPDTTAPINLNASWSELDRRNNRLLFRQLHITQGQLSIRADEASASPADFADSVWIFTGNVRILDAGTEAEGDRAELRFRNNGLKSAVLQGNPARFSQPRSGDVAPTRGQAGELNYDLATGTILMAGDASLSDGTNEITGARITYDLRREVVTAGSDAGGPVRMRITPKPRNGDAPSAPPAPPAPDRPAPDREAP